MFWNFNQMPQLTGRHFKALQGNLRITLIVPGTASWWVALVVYPFCIAYVWPFDDVIHQTGSTYCIKTPPEEDRATQSQATCIDDLAKFVHVVFEMVERHTDTQLLQYFAHLAMVKYCYILLLHLFIKVRQWNEHLRRTDSIISATDQRSWASLMTSRWASLWSDRHAWPAVVQLSLWRNKW